MAFTWCRAVLPVGAVFQRPSLCLAPLQPRSAPSSLVPLQHLDSQVFPSPTRLITFSPSLVGFGQPQACQFVYIPGTTYHGSYILHVPVPKAYVTLLAQYFSFLGYSKIQNKPKKKYVQNLETDPKRLLKLLWSAKHFYLRQSLCHCLRALSMTQALNRDKCYDATQHTYVILLAFFLN